jgi:hypothetical protein
LISQLCGWAGAAALLIAYVLVSSGKLGGKSAGFNAINVVGGGFAFLRQLGSGRLAIRNTQPDLDRDRPQGHIRWQKGRFRSVVSDQTSWFMLIGQGFASEIES